MKKKAAPVQQPMSQPQISMPTAVPMKQAATPIAASRALELSRQGLSEADIISAMQAEGYGFEEIDAALNEALKTEVSGPQQEGEQDYGLRKGFDFTNMQASSARETLAPLPQEGLQAMQLTPEEIINRKFEELEEMLESLIEEKVGKTMDAISLQKDKLQNLELKLKDIDESLENFQKSVDSVKKQMDDTKNEIDVKLSEFEPRLNSLEKAFKDVIPNIVDSMRELKEIVHGHVEASDKPQTGTQFSEYHR